ncbi:HNH endonuclease [Staphylococcus chromogenes]|nr:HNH endonuclease [Staphylococcus chromogenes]
MIHAARDLLAHALDEGVDFNDFTCLLDIKELVARIETDMARNHDRHELEARGASTHTARRITRRAAHPWANDVSVEHQDAILSALEKLSSTSRRRTEIYALGAEAALTSSVADTHAYTKKLVREENHALARDPFEAHHQRRLSLHTQDTHGGCRITGYLPAHTAALLKALLDRAFHAQGDDTNRSIPQRTADAFDHVIKWASSNRVAATGHASLVVSVVDTAEVSWQAKFGTNVGIDLNLFDIAHLAGDRIADYIVVHDHAGAVLSMSTAARSATFYQRVALLARDFVCQHPGCGVPVSRCDAHHITPWSRGGPTEITNLGLLCPKHHRRNDDTHHTAHLDIHDGTPHWIDHHGTAHRNNSASAKRAASRHLQPI